MKVYIVTTSHFKPKYGCYGGFGIDGVYDTKEKAEARAQEIKEFNKQRETFKYIYVDVFERILH